MLATHKTQHFQYIMRASGSRMTARLGEEMFCRLFVNTQHVERVENVLTQLPSPAQSGLPGGEHRVAHPPPPVSFMEWDGSVRLLFKHKHKMLSALLVTLAMLEETFSHHSMGRT